MKYRKLGSSGLTISEIGFGTWGLGGTAYGTVDDNESKKALEAAFEAGMTFYDTADLYGDGHSEELLGEVFANRRDKVVIATKGGTLPHTTFDMPQDFSAAYVTGALHRSLKRLKTDYVDLYLLHSPKLDDICGNDELIKALEQFQRDGKVLAYGISARTPADALKVTNDLGFKVVEVNFNLIDQRALDNGLFELAKKQNLGMIIRTPLTFGFLSGKLSGDEKFEKTDHRVNWPKEQLKRWADAHHLFSFLFKDGKRTPAQSALRFCLDFDVVSTVIPGMMNVREVMENIAVTKFSPLDKSEMDLVLSIYRGNDFYDNTAKDRR